MMKPTLDDAIRVLGQEKVDQLLKLTPMQIIDLREIESRSVLPSAPNDYNNNEWAAYTQVAVYVRHQRLPITNVYGSHCVIVTGILERSNGEWVIRQQNARDVTTFALKIDTGWKEFNLVQVVGEIIGVYSNQPYSSDRTITLTVKNIALVGSPNFANGGDHES